jgi:hypothetical protein
MLSLLFIDESPRYFSAIKGQYRRAKDVLAKMADVNKTA